MTIEKLEEFLNEGEGYTLEYKESVNSLSDSVFETVSSFSSGMQQGLRSNRCNGIEDSVFYLIESFPHINV